MCVWNDYKNNNNTETIMSLSHEKRPLEGKYTQANIRQSAKTIRNRNIASFT